MTDEIKSNESIVEDGINHLNEALKCFAGISNCEHAPFVAKIIAAVLPVANMLFMIYKK